MKKLFFAAALAIVAVGGALNSNAITVYPAGLDTPFECSNGVSLCSDITPAPLYTVSASSGDQGKPGTEYTPGIDVRYQ